MGRHSNKQKKHLRSAAIARAGRKCHTPPIIEAYSVPNGSCHQVASDTEPNAGVSGTLSNANCTHLNKFEGFDDEEDGVCSWPGGVNNHSHRRIPETLARQFDV